MKRGLLLLLVFGFLPAVAGPLPYLELNKSQPVEISGLEFVAAVQSQMIVYSGGKELAVQIQLLITNRTKTDLVFRTFDTFGVTLKDAHETPLPAHGGRDGTIASPSVLIPAGETYCLSREAKLFWKLPYSSTLHPGTSALFYWDGTGMETYFDLPSAGTYFLAFAFESSDKDSTREKLELGGLPVWSGKGSTKDVSFEVIEQ
jgi:hypothetical protein